MFVLQRSDDDGWVNSPLPPLALSGIFGDLGVVSSWQAKTSWPDGYYGSLNATKASLLMFAWRKQHDVIGLINKAIMHQGICYQDSILKFMAQNFLNTKWKMVSLNNLYYSIIPGLTAPTLSPNEGPVMHNL